MTGDRVQFTRALLLGLNAVPKTGTPGNVLAWGHDAFCPILSSTGSTPFGAATFGNGRVVAFGHNNYLHGVSAGSTSEPTRRLNRLLRNSVMWTGKAECEYLKAHNIANELQCGVYCENADTSFLSAYPFHPVGCRLPLKIGALGMKMDKLKTIVSAISSDTTERFVAVAAQDKTTADSVKSLLKHPLDVILWTNTNSKQEVTPRANDLDERAELILKFLRQGGGLVVAVCPWGWESLAGGDYLASRCVFNHVLEPTGLIFKSSYADGDTGGNYPIGDLARSGGNLSHVETLAQAADALKMHGSLDKPTLSQAIVTMDGVPDMGFMDVRAAKKNLLGEGQVATRRYVQTIGEVSSKFGSSNLAFPLTIKGGLTSAKTATYMYLPWFDRFWQTQSPQNCPRAASVTTFPGDVEPRAPRCSGHLFTVNPDLEGWQTTGIYVVPGEVLEMTISDQALNHHSDLKLYVKVGSHTDKLDIIKDDDGYKLNRFPKVTSERQWQPRTLSEADSCSFCKRSPPAKASSILVATPHGGLLYVEYGGGLNSKHPDIPITFNIEGGILAPYWNMAREMDASPTVYTDSYPHRQLSISERARQYRAPWGELEGRYLIFTMSREALENVHEPMEVMTFWDNMLAHELALAGQSLKRKERLVHDKQISAGWLHSGYPVMAHMDGLELTQNRRPKIADLHNLQGSPQWGIYHEFGHNRQKGEWTWSGCGEVTVNIFSLYATQMLNGPTPYKSEYFSKNCRGVVEKYLTDSSQTFAGHWQKKCNVALGTYVVFIEQFGWPAIADVFRAYSNMKDKPKSDTDKINEWVKQTSLRVGQDLRPYYKQWKFPMNENLLGKDLDALPKYSVNVLNSVKASA